MFHIVASVYIFPAQAPYFQVFVKAKRGNNIKLWAKVGDYYLPKSAWGAKGQQTFASNQFKTDENAMDVGAVF